VPTLILFAFVFGMTALAYRLIYPVIAGDSLTRLSLCDFVLMTVVLGVVGFRFYGTGVEFDFLLFQAGWFGATLLSLCVSEAFLLPAYLRRFNVFK
jgi:hypothetical protein